jgi:hypothetical protein
VVATVENELDFNHSKAMNQLTDRVDPLANPNVIRILLSETQSAILAATGETCFVSASRCPYPGNPAQWQILISPCNLNTLNQATRVLRGESRSVRIRKIKA